MAIMPPAPLARVLREARELAVIIGITLPLQFFFNPGMLPYEAFGPRSVFVDGCVSTAICAVATVVIVARILRRLRASGMDGAHDPRRPAYGLALPVNPWALAALFSLVLAPLGGGLFLLALALFFEGSITFFPFFWLKIGYLFLLCKLVAKAAIRRYARPGGLG